MHHGGMVNGRAQARASATARASIIIRSCGARNVAPGMGVKTLFLVLVVLAAVLEASGDVILKKWAIDGKQALFALGLAVYFAATVVWAFSLRYEFLSRAISIVTVLNLVIVVLAGALYFKEDLSAANKVGIALGIVSVVLMEL